MAEIPVTIVDTRMPILPYATTDIPSTSLTPHPLAGHPGQNNPPQEESGFADSSGPLFSMYLQLAGEEDKKMTESWKGDADGILIFTGLFSAAVAALVGVSVQDLKPSSQDISAFYLASIYQILANSNGTQVVIPPTLPNPSTPFSPPASAVWVNSLWFLSLVISLTCALLATLLQQWARRYMKVTQTRYSPPKRARIRAFFAEGVDKLHLPWAVEALPALLHLSLSLFFAGLAVFLFNINHAVFNLTMSWVGFCAGMYLCITLMPMFRHDSPYYAPLSSSAWYLSAGAMSAAIKIFRWLVISDCVDPSIYNRASDLWKTRLQRGMAEEFEETALKAPSEINGRALMWTYKTLDEDHELEQFFAGIPGFCSSKVVDDPQSSLESLRSFLVAEALKGYLERTWSSNLVSATIKIRRLVVCARAIDAARLSLAAFTILENFSQDRSAFFQSVELGHSLIRWGNNDDRETALFAQGIIACIIANVPQRNERNKRWFSLTMHHLGVSEHELRGYLDHGDSVLFANLINFTRRFVCNFIQAKWEEFPVILILWLLAPAGGGWGRGFNVQNTLPELQHKFCGLWNKIIQQGHVGGNPLLLKILRGIRPIYVALHEDPTPDGQYQPCSFPSHLMDSASNLNGDRTAETAPTPITTSPTGHHHDTVPFFTAPVTEYDAPPSPTSNLAHAIPHFVGEQSHDGVLDNITPATSSFHLNLLESDRISDGAAAEPIQGTSDPSAISSPVNIGTRSTSSHGTAARPTRNVTTATPFLVPDALPSLIPLLTVSANPAAHNISADPTVNQSGRLPDDGLISHSSSQVFTPSPFAQVNSGFDSNATTEIEPLEPPDDTLDLNHRVISQSSTQSSPEIAEHGLRPDHGVPSETSGPSQ